MEYRKQLMKILTVSLGLGVVTLLTLGIISLSHNRAPGHNGTIQIVAAENFWGSLAFQLGGSHVSVTSLVTDPNADPHEFGSTASTGRSYETADYVIENGAGYDSWSDDLLRAHQNPQRKVLNIANLVGKKAGDNPHIWYDPVYVNKAIAQMEQDLINLDPNSKSYYERQYKNLQAELAGYQNQINVIKQEYAGTKVAATEDIFVYLANAAGLDLISPPAFMQAIAEGSSEPPADSVVQFQQQLQERQVKLLVYNTQTITPITENMKKLASQQNIPVVGISETVQPPNARFQDWMNSEIMHLEATLKNS